MATTEMKPTIPVIVDGSYADLTFARCVYFCIEIDETRDAWTLGLGEATFPFFMLGLSGIVYRPADGNERFTDSTQISKLIELIEANDGRWVETSYIWLPSKLVARVEGHRNDVLRVGVDLFALALQFRTGALDASRFSEQAYAFIELVRSSPEETDAFRAWALREIERGRRWRNDDEPPPMTGGNGGPEPEPPPTDSPPRPPAAHKRRRLIEWE